MEQAIQLFGFLVLTLLGFVVPITAILLSLFQEGISKLTFQYQNEKSQTEENIKVQLRKISEKEALEENLAAIEQSLSELKAIKRRAEGKLSYLEPKKQIMRLFIPLMLAFLLVVALLLITPNLVYRIPLILISVACVAYALFILWKLMGIMIEVRRIISAEAQDKDGRTLELLTILTKQQFLKEVYLTVDDKDTGSPKALALKVNVKQQLKIGIENREEIMAKNIEVGLIFPTSFIIEEASPFSIYKDKDSQIVRHELNRLHAKTNLRLADPLTVTALEQGSFNIKTFIKAENMSATYRDMKIQAT